MSLLRTLFTFALSLALGAGLRLSIKSEPDAPAPPPETVKKAPPASRAAPLIANPPPFTSATASMDWVRTQMDKGDTTAAERLFHQDAGLTDDQRLDLAKALASNFRRMDPRVLARIILGLPRGEKADHLFWRFIADWCSYDAEDALRFIELLPSDRLNTTGVLHNAAFGLCRLPAERVLAFAGHLDDQGRAYLAEGLIAVADQAGSWRNTTAILDRLNAKPQQDAISPEWFLGRHLAEIDPQAFESRFAAETDALKHDKLIEGYTSSISRLDPERSIQMLAQMQHPKPDQITNRVEQWLTSDRAAALAWLQSDGARQHMDREARARLLRLYQRESAP
ncbi:MAG: hypothetical protein HS117_21455 [Verrucomicrobiaceae bacterium]|nr:hypothetical protein [Verrucomicrobiaceae bacterium]